MGCSPAKNNILQVNKPQKNNHNIQPEKEKSVAAPEPKADQSLHIDNLDIEHNNNKNNNDNDTNEQISKLQIIQSQSEAGSPEMNQKRKMRRAQSQKELFQSESRNFYKTLQNMQQQTNYQIQDIFSEPLDQNKPTKKKIAVIRRGNNPQLFINYFSHQKNWVAFEQTSKYEYTSDFKWICNAYQVEWYQFNEGQQIINHVCQAYDAYCTKSSMAICLKEYEQNHQNTEITTSQFFPKTIILELGQKEYTQDEIDFLNTDNNEIWISKPSDQFGGRGVELIQNMSSFKSVYKKIKGSSQYYKSQIVQKYIENPLLIDGKKFDIRCFVVIACTKPLLVLYHEGFAFRSLKTYVSPKINSDKTIHVANILLQKKDPFYRQKIKDIGWSMQQLAQYLEETCNLSKEQIEDIDLQIKKILCYVVISGLHKIKRLSGTFELFGCDVTIDDQFKVHFIEMNESPGLSFDCQAEEDAYPQLVYSMLDIVLELNKDQQLTEQKLKNDEINFKAFSILINEAKNISLIDYNN